MIVNIKNLLGFNTRQICKIKQACKLLEQVMNSDAFKTALLQLSFIERNGLSNQQIYDLIMSGNDNQEGPDREVDLELRFYYRWWSKVIGYVLPNGEQYINGKFLDRMSAANVAGNLGHEYCHKLGFIDPNRDREQSVPYKVGYLIEELAAQIEEMNRKEKLQAEFNRFLKDNGHN